MTTIKRENTIKATFDKNKQRPSALDIHTWIDETLKIKENELQTIQLVGKQNAAYIKFNSAPQYEKYLRQHAGTTTLDLLNGAQTTVTITTAEEDCVSVRVLNIPPEVPNERIKNVLQNYGKVQHIENEKWSQRYKFKIDSGIRIVQMVLSKPIPSNITVSNYEAYVSYPGQENKCFSCGSATHLRQHCPNRNIRTPVNTNLRTPLTMSDLFKAPTTSTVGPTERQFSEDLTKSAHTTQSDQLHMTTSHVKLSMQPEKSANNNTNIDTENATIIDTGEPKKSDEFHPQKKLRTEVATATRVCEQNISVDSDTDSCEEQTQYPENLHDVIPKLHSTNIADEAHSNTSQGKNYDASETAKQHDQEVQPLHYSWHEEMEEENHQRAEPAAVSNILDSEQQKHAKGNTSIKKRIHPYKSENKLGFPPLRKQDT